MDKNFLQNWQRISNEKNINKTKKLEILGNKKIELNSEKLEIAKRLRQIKEEINFLNLEIKHHSNTGWNQYTRRRTIKK